MTLSTKGAGESLAAYHLVQRAHETFKECEILFHTTERAAD